MIANFMVYNLLNGVCGTLLVTIGLLAIFAEKETEVTIPGGQVVIIDGIITSLFTLFGCFVAVNKKRCIITTYGILLLLLSILHIILAWYMLYGLDVDNIVNGQEKIAIYLTAAATISGVLGFYGLIRLLKVLLVKCWDGLLDAQTVQISDAGVFKEDTLKKSPFYFID